MKEFEETSSFQTVSSGWQSALEGVNKTWYSWHFDMKAA